MNRKERKSISRNERLWRIAVTVLGALFLWCIITYLVTPLFMTHPHKNKEAEALLGSSGAVRSISLYGAYELSGYLLDDPDADTLLIYFYGISDDAASSMLEFLDIRSAGGVYSNVDIAVVDWPSYGNSKGFCSDRAMRDSACEVVNAFKEGRDIADYSCTKVVIIGYSLGSGPAVYAASVCGCSDLILISPYYSSADLYNNVTPIFYGPFKSLLSFNMETCEYASDVTISPLIVATPDDTRVPFSGSEKLAATFPSGSDLRVFSGIRHGDMPSDPDVLKAIGERLSAY